MLKGSRSYRWRFRRLMLASTNALWLAHVSFRTNVDDGREFVNGCVPNWSADCAIRSPATVEHKLSWAYCRVRGRRAALGHTDQV